MAIESKTQIIRAEGLMSASVDQELVILNMATNNYIGLDTIGRRIWEMIEKPLSVDELYDILSREFDVQLKQFEADVLPFLEELKHEGLIRIVGQNKDSDH